MIAIDAGNTRIKWGVHDATGWVARGALPTADAGLLREQAGDWPQEAQLLACNVAGASVEGEITSALVVALRADSLAAIKRQDLRRAQQLR